MKLNKNFFLKALIPAALILTPAAMAQEGSYNTVEFEGIDCSATTGEEMTVMLRNFGDRTATVTATDLNGKQTTVSQRVRLFETVQSYERYQLEMLAQTASPEEGQAVYQAALDQIIAAEEACVASTADTTTSTANPANDEEPADEVVSDEPVDVSHNTQAKLSLKM